MKITNNPQLASFIYNNIRETVSRPREGIHVSDLVLCLRKAYWRMKGLSPEASKDTCLLWMTGYAFQAYMFPLDEEATIFIDSIYCTPDVEQGVEVKTTRQSSARFDPSSMTHWHRQILSYCKAVGKLDYNLAVMFVCGNYKPPFPTLDCWHFEFTKEEVNQNWEDMLTRKALLWVALENNTPPVPNCEDWEWQYCENINLCTDTACYRKKTLKERR